jgi:quercetin dioxygenase-like cupin family protein
MCPAKSIRGVLVEYEPGGSSPAHTHPNSAFIYATVLEGAIQSQVNDGPVTTYRAGESFSEFPGDRHGVSENASTTESARLLLPSCQTGMAEGEGPGTNILSQKQNAPHPTT